MCSILLQVHLNFASHKLRLKHNEIYKYSSVELLVQHINL